jgi:hypothetical protein
MSDAVRLADPGADLPELTDALDAFARLLAERGDGGEAVAADVSGWSVAQHGYHTFLAAGLALRNVAQLVAGEGMLIRHDAEPSELFPQLVAGGFPEGTQAPRMVVPPAAVDPELLQQEIDGARAAARETAGILDAIDGASGRIPHQLLGALTAGEWLRFARMHTQHHLGIARRVAAATADGA